MLACGSSHRAQAGCTVRRLLRNVNEGSIVTGSLGFALGSELRGLGAPAIGYLVARFGPRPALMERCAPTNVAAAAPGCLYTGIEASGGGGGSMERATYNELTPRERHVIEDRGTEPAFSGEYDDFYEAGTYLCRRCDAELYRASDKFDAHCGWPAFDDEVAGAVRRLPDPDGFRIEIECTGCGGHLGHVFLDEGLTTKNTRHCVNSLSMRFVPAT